MIQKVNREKFKTEQETNMRRLKLLLTNDKLSREPYIEINKILQTKAKDEYWYPEDQSQKDEIVEGFKGLYLHNDKKKQYTAKDLATKLNQIIEEADKNKDILLAQPAPFTPRSYAKDFYGFSQRELMSLISKENGYTSLLNYQYLVTKLYPLQHEELVFHTISKVILKKRKT